VRGVRVIHRHDVRGHRRADDAVVIGDDPDTLRALDQAAFAAL
jgi:hypothetical protein